MKPPTHLSPRCAGELFSNRGVGEKKMFNYQIVTAVVKSKEKPFGAITHLPEFDFVAFVSDGKNTAARFFKDGKIVKENYLEGVSDVASGFFEYPKIFAIGTRNMGEDNSCAVLISLDYYTEPVVREIPGSDIGLHISQTREGEFDFRLSYKNKNNETLISGVKLVKLGSKVYLMSICNTVVYGSVDNISEYIVE